MRERPPTRDSLGCVASTLQFAAAMASMPQGRAEPLRSREYAPGYQSDTFFVPRQTKIDAVGVVNEDTAYAATRSSILTLHRDGPPTPVIQVDGEEIVAFHLCHHRNSIFYEVLARDGGTLSIFEFSLSVRAKTLVQEFQDAVPAVSLACADQWLLRVSPSALVSIHISDGLQSELRWFEEHPISSLSVAYAADIIEHAEVFYANPGNRTISRLRLKDDGEGLLHVEAVEALLSGGDGSDGPSEHATVQEPQHVVWSNDKVIFTDGCMLREIAAGHVRTLLGIPACVPSANETLEPVPWATRLSRPQGLAVSTDGTSSRAMLLLTESQVVCTSEAPSQCTAVSADGHGTLAKCAAGFADDEHHQHQCGWAEGQDAHEQLCFECSALHRWAASQHPAVDVCGLELSARRDTRYDLRGCGCSPPTPDPHHGADIEAARIQMNLSILLIIVVVGAAVVFLYRRGRRVVAAREEDSECGDIAEFHMFTDGDTSLH